MGLLLTEKNLPLVGIQDLATHLHRRKNWSRGMSPAAIKEYEPFISMRIRQLLEKLESQTRKEIILGSWTNYWSCVVDT